MFPRRHKYNAKKHKVEVDGVEYEFSSKLEADRYVYLKGRENRGEISDLDVQPRFMLQDKFKAGKKAIRAIHYIADFIYLEEDQVVVEDTKGFKTPDYKLKMKLFLNTYQNIVFIEVGKKRKEFVEVAYDRRDTVG